MPIGSCTNKFGFRIRTRQGPVVDNLRIHGRDRAEAERKLRQIYRNCEVLGCAAPSGTSADATSFQDIVNLVAK